MRLYVDANFASPYALVTYVSLKRPTVQEWVRHPRPPLREY
jgi:hypothetical protein